MRTVVNNASSQQAGSAALAKSKPAALLPRNARGTVVVPAPAVAGPSRPSTAVAALADGKDAEQSHASRKRVVARVAMDPAAEEVKSVAWSVVMHTSRSLAENIFTSAGLAMTVIAEDGTKIVSNESLFGFTKERWQDPKELAGTKFLGKVNLPAGVRPAAVELSRTFGPKMLIESLHFKSSDTGLDIFFTCEGYLTKGTPRVFFGSTALPNQTPVGIRDLRRQELLDLKGVGNPDLHALRKADDRIYDYAVYNDLGNVEKGNVRVPLGGTPDYPYPRRMATNRDTVLYNDGNKYEVLPSGLLGKPWVPHDDAFDPDKSAGFVGNAIVSFLPAIQLLDFPPKKEFKNMQDYLSLFDNDEGQLEPALPRSGESAFMLLFQAQKAIAVTASKIKQAVAGRSLVDGIVDLFAPYNDIGDIFQYPAPYNVANPRRGHMSEAQFREVQQELDVDSKVTDTSRVDVWRTDEEFGRQFVAGINPMVLVAMGAASGKGLPANTKITAADLQPFLAEGETVEGLMAADKPRLFYIDYYAVIADALDDIQRANPQSNRAQHAGHCILYRRPDGHLVPIAIDLTSDAHNPKAGLQVFTPADKGAVWPIAKAIFMSIDSGYHQLISHWLRTHACQEPYLIATRRCLSSMHPVYKLIMPHFRYTAQINANARASLINAGGTIEKCFTPGSTAMALSSKVYGAIWNFATEALPADLKLRGFLDESGKLNVEDYPYAEDGLLIWNAIEGYFKEYINLYYKNDAEVLADEEIQDWWTDIRTKGHGDKANAEGCWPELTTRANLVYVLATIAWMGSAHHAAVNFGQYDYAAFMPAHSSMIRKPMPKRNSDEFKVLAKSIGDTADYHLLSFMATPSEATRVTTVVKLLTVHARDEQYLSDTDQEWITDPAAMKLHAKFVEEIKEADHIISGRNMHPTGTARSLAANGLPYRYMIPSSAPGSTGQGVPYSISI